MKSIQEFALEHSEILEVNYDYHSNTFKIKTKFPPVEIDWVEYLWDCLKPYYTLLKDFDQYKRREYLNSNLSFPQFRYWEDFISLFLVEDQSSIIHFKHQNGLISEIILKNVNLKWEEEVINEEIIPLTEAHSGEEEIILKPQPNLSPNWSLDLSDSYISISNSLIVNRNENRGNIKIPPEPNFPKRKNKPHCLEPPKEDLKKQSFNTNLVANPNLTIRYG